MLKIGDKAPDFETVTDTGEPFSLKKFRGKKFMLFFYPKDNTSGCKAEVCSIRDSYDVFKKNDIETLAESFGKLVKKYLKTDGIQMRKREKELVACLRFHSSI